MKLEKRNKKYSITCIQRPLRGSNECGLLLQVVFKYRFYFVDKRGIVVTELWILKAGALLTISQTRPGFNVSFENTVGNGEIARNE